MRFAHINPQAIRQKNPKSASGTQRGVTRSSTKSARRPKKQSKGTHHSVTHCCLIRLAYSRHIKLGPHLAVQTQQDMTGKQANRSTSIYVPGGTQLMHMNHVFSRHTFGLEQLGIHLGNRLEQLGIHLGIQSTGAKLLRGGGLCTDWPKFVQPNLSLSI